MDTFSWTMIGLLVCLYVLFPWYIIMQEDKRRNEIKNQPLELWRINNWHLIDKVRVRDFLIADLKELKKGSQNTSSTSEVKK